MNNTWWDDSVLKDRILLLRDGPVMIGMLTPAGCEPHDPAFKGEEWEFTHFTDPVKNEPCLQGILGEAQEKVVHKLYGLPTNAPYHQYHVHCVGYVNVHCDLQLAAWSDDEAYEKAEEILTVNSQCGSSPTVPLCPRI